MRTLTKTAPVTTTEVIEDIVPIAKVTNGQFIRCSGWSAYKAVASHCPGYLHGISVTFTNGDSLVALPDTLVEVK